VGAGSGAGDPPLPAATYTAVVTELDPLQISRELVRALRGERSQTALSRQLGFRSNVAYAWEHGRRYPEMSFVLRAAAAKRSTLREDLARFFDLPEDVFAGRRAHAPRTVTLLVQHLVSNTPKVRLARRLGVDRTTLGRWVSGKTEPRLPEFLSLLQATTQRLLIFVALFADLAKLPSTKEPYAHLKKQQRLAYDLPMSHAVLRALELTAYQSLPRHESRFIADHVGIDVAEVERLLAELVGAGLVVKRREHYAAQEILTVDTRVDPKKNRSLKEFWAREALSRFSAEGEPAETLFSFNLFAVSEEGYQRIRELHLDYYDRVRAIIDQSPTADRVLLMNLQLMPLHDAKARSSD